ncbi:ATP-binding cassette domain-containing protein [bacterium]|nr:ATP-binding cassette domain-containing protein [bacterium]
MLHLDHVTLEQGSFRLTANWAIEKGTRLALLGGSGAGKSSLLMALAGFLPLQSGRILWAGQDISGLEPAARPVSILFQDQNLFPHLTLVQNLGLALNPRLRLTDVDRSRIEAVLDRLGLSGLGPRKPADLSGGQQGRAALGRVLLQSREVLLLDEPFAALGPALKTDLLALVAELASASGTTVVMVTHDPADARRFADQVVLVHDGLTEPPAATAALFADPPEALRAYLGS